MIATGHHHFVARSVHCLEYSLIVSSHDCATNISGGERTLNDPANHWLSCDFE
jgi:hypothetical protein